MERWGDGGWWREHDESDVGVARDNLDSLLQTLTDNPEKAKESTKYKDDPAVRKENREEKDKFRQPFFKSNLDIKRKKRRAHSDDDETYKEGSPLYPMARAWIRNLNGGDSSSWNDVPSLDDDPENNDQLPDCHYTLPKPIDGLSDNDVRIPPPLPTQDQPFLINVENPSKEMSPEGLLEQHIARWREVRRKWKAACHENEERYMESYLILKDTYDKFCKDIQ